MKTATRFLMQTTRAMLDLLLPASAEVRQLERADKKDLMTRAKRAVTQLPGIVSMFDYKDPLVKALVWQIKFKGNRALAHLAAETMYEHLIAELSDLALFYGNTPVALVPVPLSKGRLEERGFNQTDRLAEELLRLDGGKHFSISHLVSRIRETNTQTQTRNRTERLKNLSGAFAVTENVAGKHIIVLDDVATTGSTIGEIKKVLREGGAAEVVGFTLAH